MEYQELKKLLEDYGQEHVLLSYERLDENGKEKLFPPDRCNYIFCYQWHG